MRFKWAENLVRFVEVHVIRVFILWKFECIYNGRRIAEKDDKLEITIPVKLRTLGNVSAMASLLR